MLINEINFQQFTSNSNKDQKKTNKAYCLL